MHIVTSLTYPFYTINYRLLHRLALARGRGGRDGLPVRRGHHGHEPDRTRGLQRGKQVRGKKLDHFTDEQNVLHSFRTAKLS